MKYRFITLGTVASDTFIYLSEARVDCLLSKKRCYLSLTYGDKIPVDGLSEEVGGNAANLSVGMTKLGQTTAIVGNIGNDDKGRNIKKALRFRGVHTQHLKTRNGRTNASVIITHKGERTILTYHPKRPLYSGSLPKTEWMYVTGMQSRILSKMIIDLIKKHNLKIAFNPSSAQFREGIRKLKLFLQYTEVLFVNRSEAEKIAQIRKGTGRVYVKKLLEKLKNLGASIVVITDGPKGAYSFDGNNAFGISQFPAKKIEPTGAGDSFAAGFLGALLLKKSLDMALAWGSVNSASVITEIGAQVGLLTKSEITRRLNMSKSFKAKKI